MDTSIKTKRTAEASSDYDSLSSQALKRNHQNQMTMLGIFDLPQVIFHLST
jgi:hypothetical protein